METRCQKYSKSTECFPIAKNSLSSKSNREHSENITLPKQEFNTQIEESNLDHQLYRYRQVKSDYFTGNENSQNQYQQLDQKNPYSLQIQYFQPTGQNNQFSSEKEIYEGQLESSYYGINQSQNIVSTNYQQPEFSMLTPLKNYHYQLNGYDDVNPVQKGFIRRKGDYPRYFQPDEAEIQAYVEPIQEIYNPSHYYIEESNDYRYHLIPERFHQVPFHQYPTMNNQLFYRNQRYPQPKVIYPHANPIMVHEHPTLQNSRRSQEVKCLKLQAILQNKIIQKLKQKSINRAQQVTNIQKKQAPHASLENDHMKIHQEFTQRISGNQISKNYQSLIKLQGSQKSQIPSIGTSKTYNMQSSKSILQNQKQMQLQQKMRRPIKIGMMPSNILKQSSKKNSNYDSTPLVDDKKNEHYILYSLPKSVQLDDSEYQDSLQNLGSYLTENNDDEDQKYARLIFGDTCDDQNDFSASQSAYQSNAIQIDWRNAQHQENLPVQNKDKYSHSSYPAYPIERRKSMPLSCQKTKPNTPQQVQSNSSPSNIIPSRQQLIGIVLPSKQLQIPISAVSNMQIPYRKRHRKVLYPPEKEGDKPLMKRYFCAGDFVKMREGFKKMQLGELSQNGEPINLKFLSKELRCGASTLHKFYKAWLEDPLLTHYIKKHSRRQQLKPGLLKYGLTNKMSHRLEVMNQLIKENPFLSKEQLVSNIQDRLNVVLEPNTIRRLLALGGYKKTQILHDFKKRNTPEIVEERYNYCVNYRKMANVYDIYFMNLSELKLHRFYQRKYAWAKQGYPVNTNNVQFKQNCVNLFAVISNRGYINYDYKKGVYTEEEYKKVLQKFFQGIKAEQHPTILIIEPDPEIYEKDKISLIHDMCTRNNVELQFLPLCSPQLNPLHLYFKEIRTKLKNLPHKTEEMISFNMVEILAKITPNNVVKAFQDVSDKVIEGINRLPF